MHIVDIFFHAVFWSSLISLNSSNPNSKKILPTQNWSICSCSKILNETKIPQYKHYKSLTYLIYTVIIEILSTMKQPKNWLYMTGSGIKLLMWWHLENLFGRFYCTWYYIQAKQRCYSLKTARYYTKYLVDVTEIYS